MYLLKPTVYVSGLLFPSFTFHYVSIKTPRLLFSYSTSIHLHSTMYLLKQPQHNNNHYKKGDLHSTMYLLKLLWTANLSVLCPDLHSTMYLLKRIKILYLYCLACSFTFHYVSIKTAPLGLRRLLVRHLHSTMYLLKQLLEVSWPALLIYLHSTMYLLKPRNLQYSFNFFRIYIPLCIY